MHPHKALIGGSLKQGRPDVQIPGFAPAGFIACSHTEVTYLIMYIEKSRRKWGTDLAPSIALCMLLPSANTLKFPQLLIHFNPVQHKMNWKSLPMITNLCRCSKTSPNIVASSKQWWEQEIFLHPLGIQPHYTSPYPPTHQLPDCPASALGKNRD
jgi:hypothetical protein